MRDSGATAWATSWVLLAVGRPVPMSWGSWPGPGELSVTGAPFSPYEGALPSAQRHPPPTPGARVVGRGYRARSSHTSPNATRVTAEPFAWEVPVPWLLVAMLGPYKTEATIERHLDAADIQPPTRRELTTPCRAGPGRDVRRADPSPQAALVHPGPRGPGPRPGCHLPRVPGARGPCAGPGQGGSHNVRIGDHGRAPTRSSQPGQSSWQRKCRCDWPRNDGHGRS